jgi:ubiquinone/menaquinone biosynthesis C-methylase UbiE
MEVGLNAFNALADTYDDVFSNSPIGQAQRRSVWKEMDQEFQPGQAVLEINCGTGIDALHLAHRGVRLDACDAAPAMIAKAQERARAVSADLPVRFRCLSIEDLDRVRPNAPYDGVFSNFSGLNCIEDMHSVARSLSRLVKPGGRAVLCVFGTFCAWEILWYLSGGKLRKAFRRLRRSGLEAAVGPQAHVTVHYRSLNGSVRAFAPHFRLKRWCGVGVVVPPSYAAAVPARFPKLFRLAAAADPILGHFPGLRHFADHMVLVLERVDTLS